MRERIRDDAGIGLVEVAVAIVVLGIILVALFPVLVNTLQLSVQNAEVAQANRVLSSELDVARSSLLEDECGNTDTYDVDDYRVTRTVGSCPAPQRLANVTINVAKSDEPGKALSSADTRMIVRPVVVTP